MRARCRISIVLLKRLCIVHFVYVAVVDPGFPREGPPTPRGGGRQHTILPNFLKNCMKLKEFGPPGGGGACPSRPP